MLGMTWGSVVGPGAAAVCCGTSVDGIVLGMTWGPAASGVTVVDPAAAAAVCCGTSVTVVGPAAAAAAVCCGTRVDGIAVGMTWGAAGATSWGPADAAVVATEYGEAGVGVGGVALPSNVRGDLHTLHRSPSCCTSAGW